MPFVPFLNGVEAVLNFTLAGQQVKNVLNFVASDTPDFTTMSTLATGLIDAVTGSTWWTNVLSDEIIFDSIKVVDLDTDFGLSFEWILGTTVILPQHPTSTQPAIPNNSCLVITHRTNS